VSTTKIDRDGILALRDAVAMHTPKAVARWMEVVSPSERASQVAALSKPDKRRLVSSLDVPTGVELFDSIDTDLAARLIGSMPHPEAATLLDALDVSRAAAILRFVDRAMSGSVLSALPAEKAKALSSLLSWPLGSVAAHMRPDVLTVDPGSSAAQAVEEIRNSMSRRRNRAHAGDQLYVVGPEQQLLGVLPYRSLVLARADQPVDELAADDVSTVGPLDDASQAAAVLTRDRLAELAVVDAEGRLIGVLTEDEALELLEDKATESAEKQGGSLPLDVPYLRASPWLLWRKRIVWLLVLFIAEAYTGTVLGAFADEMEAVVALAFFIPLLIGTGGNTGTQITTTLVRAMGMGQVRFRDMPSVIAKELSTGALIAVAMAAAGMVRAWTLGVGPQVGATVALTLAAIVVWSAFVASILPLVLKKLRIDPAIVSAPLIATIVDGTGLMIYFVIAHLMLPELAGL
jgi:magnesium transporter